MKKMNVLFVDDDEHILRALKRGFVDEPYELLFANSGQEALDILNQKNVHVIVGDMCMPDMGGLELLGKAKEKHPHVIRIMLSGSMSVDGVLNAVNEAKIFKFITKSSNYLDELKEAIIDALEYYHQSHEASASAEKRK